MSSHVAENGNFEMFRRHFCMDIFSTAIYFIAINFLFPFQKNGLEMSFVHELDVKKVACAVYNNVFE